MFWGKMFRVQGLRFGVQGQAFRDGLSFGSHWVRGPGFPSLGFRYLQQHRNKAGVGATVGAATEATICRVLERLVAHPIAAYLVDPNRDCLENYESNA